MKEKLLEVVMPCYNAEKYIGIALESLLNQTYKNFAVWVIDDGSQDKTRNIVYEYMKKDNRVQLVCNECNKGVAYSRNLGLKLCKSKYIAYMDADDCSRSDRFEKQIDFLERNLDIGAVSAGYVMIDEFGEVVGKGKSEELSSEEIKATFLFSDVFANAIAMFRRQVVEDNKLSYCASDKVAEDYRFWCDFIKYSNLYIMDDILYQYRQLNNSLTKVYRKSKNIQESLMSIHKKMLEVNNIKLEKEQEKVFLLTSSSVHVILEKQDIVLLKKAVNQMSDQVRRKGHIRRAKIIEKKGKKLIWEKRKDYYLRYSFWKCIYNFYRKIVYGE